MAGTGQGKSHMSLFVNRNKPLTIAAHCRIGSSYGEAVCRDDSKAYTAIGNSEFGILHVKSTLKSSDERLDYRLSDLTIGLKKAASRSIHNRPSPSIHIYWRSIAIVHIRRK